MRFEYALVGVFALLCEAANFTIINGQIFTPGLAIVDAPQPYTPLGGDTLEVALDVSGDGKLSLPPYAENQPTLFFNITIFLTSYVTGLNLTISNGTATDNDVSLGDIMASEPGSTVKHVKWTWPACLVGNGIPTDNTTSRGSYNISIHQNFKLNNTNYYTIFDLPISVTNLIDNDTFRIDCSLLNNTLQSPSAQAASAVVILPAQFPWTNGQGTQVVPAGSSSSSSSSGGGSGSSGSSGSSSSPSISSSSSVSSPTPEIGGQKPGATPGDGLSNRAALTSVFDPILGIWSMVILSLLLF